MKKKKGTAKKQPTIQQAINHKFLKAIEKIQSTETKLNNLVSFTEYLAGQIDLSISYSKYLSSNRNTQLVGQYGITPDRASTFQEFKQNQKIKDEDEIPF